MMFMIQSIPWLIMDWKVDLGTGLSYAGLWLSSGLYKVAMVVFELFLILSSGKLVDPADFEYMITNMYLIIGVVMLFVIAFFLLKAMINPDDQSKSTSGIKKIITNIFTSAIILAVLPTVFSFMFDFQDSFITEYNVIGKFFGFGDLNENPVAETPLKRVQQGSYKLVNGVYTAFLNVDETTCISETCGADFKINSSSELTATQEKIIGDKGATFSDAIKTVNTSGKMSIYYQFAENANKFSNTTEVKLDFDFLMCLVGGFLLVYIGINYCFDMALRLVKLVFYQAIAPIPVLLRIVPEGKMSSVFNQWLKITFTCYLEVFVRMFIFYFVIYLGDKLTQQGSFLDNTVFQYGEFIGLLAKAFTFMGLVMFMKQAPKLIADVTGIDSGNMKLGIRDKLADGGAFAVGALAGGAVSTGAKNAWNAAKNVKKKFQESRKAGDSGFTTARKTLGATFRGAGSVVAGTVSGGLRGGYGAKNAKNFTDMKNAATSGASSSVSARDKRASYKASHGGNIVGAGIGHVKDALKSGQRFFTDESIEGLSRESRSMGEIVSKYNTFNDTIEQLLQKEQAKGKGSIFAIDAHGNSINGFNNEITKQYEIYDKMSKNKKAAQAAFNSGQVITYEYYDFDDDGNIIATHTATGKVDADTLSKIEGSHIKSQDFARDKVMDMIGKGSNSGDYNALTAKGQAALKESYVNSESLLATIIENANSDPIQEIMGERGNGALKDIMNKKPFTVKSFEYKINGKTVKLKDSAKVKQGQADIKIAELNKEQAAKGDKK